MNGHLSLDAVSIHLSGKVLVSPLTASIGPGQVLTIMGASGVGKSTLLAFVGGTLAPAFSAYGTVRINGRDMTGVAPEQRRIGVLFQDDLLFPHLSVAGNLAFGLAPGVRGAARRARIDDALARAGLSGFGNHDPATLSGGQRARVSLLRALLAEPHAILLDEPFSKLDRSLRQEFRAYVFDHCRQVGLPALLVTHDEDDAMAARGPIVTLTAS